MPDFETLFQTVLSQASLDKEKLLKLIEEKKRRVGAGYLTDQGALFLVAADLGVSLRSMASSDINLGDLYIGANDITVTGRIFAIYPIKRYVKKDGSEGSYRRLIIFDKEAFVKLTLWDDKVHSIESLSLKIDDVIKVVKGYVKSSLDGRPVLHVGLRGEVEPVTDENILSKLPTLDSLVKDVEQIKSVEQNLAVEGVVKSPPRFSSFVRGDGAAGSVAQIYLSSLLSEKTVRIALWNSESKGLLEIPLNSVIKMVNVKSRLTPYGEIELHGDESTRVEITSIEGGERVEKRALGNLKALRLLSVGLAKEGGEASGGTALVVDELKTFYTLAATGEVFKKLLEMKADSIFQCSIRALGSSTLVCEEPDSIRLLPEDRSFLDSSSIKFKVNRVEDKSIPIILEAIALSRPSIQEVSTKDGSIVKRSEIVVGDETGEIKVVAWRRHTDLLQGIMPGQRLRLKGVIPKLGRDGAPFLLIRSYTSIEKVI